MRNPFQELCDYFGAHLEEINASLKRIHEIVSRLEEKGLLEDPSDNIDSKEALNFVYPLYTSYQTLIQACRQNKIPHIKAGSRYVFSKEQLRKWMNAGAPNIGLVKAEWSAGNYLVNGRHYEEDEVSTQEVLDAFLEEKKVIEFRKRTKATRGEVMAAIKERLSQNNETDEISKGLENISELLYSVPIINLSGVYFLCQDGEVVYVGQSENCLSRVNAHFDKEFNEALFLKVDEEYRADVEMAFIKLLKPKYNIQGLGYKLKKN